MDHALSGVSSLAGAGCGMPLRFCIQDVLDDVLDDGELHFVETAKTLKAASRRIEPLAAVWPGQYVIYNEQTGERVSITAGTEPRTLPLEPRFGKNTHSIV